jgi:hypothetical protein
MTGRLLLLKEAKAYLAQLDPRTLGVRPVTLQPLRFDRREIDAALDARREGGALSPPPAQPEAANDETDPDAELEAEFADLDARLAAHSQPGAQSSAGRPPRR